MTRLNLAVVADDPPVASGLAVSTERDTRVSAYRVATGRELPSDVDGVIVDVPLAKRYDALSSIAERTNAPILTEMPVGPSAELCRALGERLSGHRVVSLNPLAYHTPTKRLLEHVSNGADPLETYFAVWRFHPLDRWDHGLAQLVGFADSLTRSAPIRISALRRSTPAILVALLRYENGVVGSVEIGAHLPEASAQVPELLIECFCRDSAYQCHADNQAITLEAKSRAYHTWAPDPSAAMLSTFLDMLHGDQMPQRGIADDLRTLAICEEILAAATDRTVRQPVDGVLPPA